MNKKLSLKKEEILKLLQSLGKINDTAIFDIKEDRIEALSSSEDRSMCLLGTLMGEFEEMVLNIPNIGKLEKLIKMIPSDDIELNVESNHISYSGGGIRFKYHLYDDGILTRSKISPEKLRNFVYPVNFEIPIKNFSNLVKKISVIRSTKIYVHGECGEVFWAFDDKSTHNSDNLTIIDGEVDKDFEVFITNTSNLGLINLCGDQILFKISDVAGNISTDLGNLNLSYTINSLSK